MNVHEEPQLIVRFQRDPAVPERHDARDPLGREGPWTLIAEEGAAQDIGRIRGFALGFTLGRIEDASQAATDGHVAVGAR
ncbi:hypothetical protein [Geodermatophilus obscurus]|uniref:Uncharacterized protein n=1 Tax=Geodermatophilus obscurus (strain ATCC 25078 / DSM 43160 / JCM 3152 / CCUG 61914 / KCC A-0152 / KCTC 9177 / NBRC 13315 / NRRL B-3577 / G-20) TaxID=526225 RepID=D2SAM1_GEOOG|nr:hypothetical protein [Geodermatophilus obscurus]ADB73950.1 hypothetical protein Gobs_1202 [Geodermatophilus obscurus DSM 43160]